MLDKPLPPSSIENWKHDRFPPPTRQIEMRVGPELHRVGVLLSSP